jgi:D-sedoheptulose 7-phosphate isomerase
MLVEFYENVLAVRRVAVPQADPAALATSQLDDPDRLHTVDHAFETAIRTLRETRVALGEKILEAANLMIACLHRGGKIMVCGAGAAEADARQFSAELMGHSLLSGHTGLPVLMLSGEMRPSAYPANTTDHETVFSRQVEALGRPGDLLFGIAREDNRAGLPEAFRSARLHNLTCLSLTGPDAEHLALQMDVALVVPGSNARWTRQVQLLLLDLLCDLVEEQLTGVHSLPAENLYEAGSALRLLKRLVE